MYREQKGSGPAWSSPPGREGRSYRSQRHACWGVFAPRKQESAGRGERQCAGFPRRENTEGSEPAARILGCGWGACSEHRETPVQGKEQGAPEPPSFVGPFPASHTELTATVLEGAIDLRLGSSFFIKSNPVQSLRASCSDTRKSRGWLPVSPSWGAHIVKQCLLRGSWQGRIAEG